MMMMTTPCTSSSSSYNYRRRAGIGRERRRQRRGTTPVPILLPLLLLLLLQIIQPGVVVVSPVSGYTMGGFQSGPSLGAVYAGGLHYEPETEIVYMTGSHYNTDLIAHDGNYNQAMTGTELDGESSCYVTRLDLSQSNALLLPTTDSTTTETGGEEGKTFHTLSHWQSYGDPGVMETCAAITTNTERAFVVGSVEKGGFFHKNSDYPVVGLVANLNKDTFQTGNAVTTTAPSNPMEHLLFPVVVLKSHYNDNHLFVAALTSTDTTNNSPNTDQQQQPNWQEYHKYGSSFYLSVMAYTYNENKNNLDLKWIQEFPVDAPPVTAAGGPLPPSVWIGGMLLQRDSNKVQHLVIAGSTRGAGQAYGAVEPGSEDEDGFIVQLRVEDGTFLQQARHDSKKTYVGTNNLREGTGADDLIRGVCHTSASQDEFYIVGGTKGDMTTNAQGMQNDLEEVNAGFQFGAGVEAKYRDLWVREDSLMPFLRRVSFAKKLGPVWTTQWAAMPSTVNTKSGKATRTNAYAMDCAVDTTSQAVFVVGTVLNGARMAQGDIEMINQGGHDIWVAKVDERTGNVHWLTQLGNYGDESPARHSSIAVNKDGNVVIYGDTTSTLYRSRDDKNEVQPDMFIMVLDGKTGAVDDKYYMGGTSSATVAGDVDGVPKPVAQPPNPNKQPQNSILPDDDDDQYYAIPGTSSNPSKNSGGTANVVPAKGGELVKNGMSTTGDVFLALFIILTVLCVLCYLYRRYRKQKKAQNQKSSIFACLQKFDVEDIDLRRSPPGGWHGTYMNDLAHGENLNNDGYKDGIMVTEFEDVNAPLTSDRNSDSTNIPNNSLFTDPDTSRPSLEDGGGGGYRDNFDIGDEDEIDIQLNKGKMV